MTIGRQLNTYRELINENDGRQEQPLVSSPCCCRPPPNGAFGIGFSKKEHGEDAVRCGVIAPLAHDGSCAAIIETLWGAAGIRSCICGTQCTDTQRFGHREQCQKCITFLLHDKQQGECRVTRWMRAMGS